MRQNMHSAVSDAPIYLAWVGSGDHGPIQYLMCNEGKLCLHEHKVTKSKTITAKALFQKKKKKTSERFHWNWPSVMTQPAIELSESHKSIIICNPNSFRLG